MNKIVERYAAAVNRGDLSSDARSTFAGADVCGAFGLASRKYRLAAALARMFVGGDKEAREVSRMMTRMLVSKAYQWGQPIGEAGADIMAGLVLHWHRDSACKVCGGHGFKLLFDAELGDGRGVVSDSPCPACGGSGKRPFEAMFPIERVPLANWLRGKVERETALAGPAAMRKLAPDLTP